MAKANLDGEPNLDLFALLKAGALVSTEEYNNLCPGGGKVLHAW